MKELYTSIINGQENHAPSNHLIHKCMECKYLSTLLFDSKLCSELKSIIKFHNNYISIINSYIDDYLSRNNLRYVKLIKHKLNTSNKYALFQGYIFVFEICSLTNNTVDHKCVYGGCQLDICYDTDIDSFYCIANNHKYYMDTYAYNIAKNPLFSNLIKCTIDNMLYIFKYPDSYRDKTYLIDDDIKNRINKLIKNGNSELVDRLLIQYESRSIC